jgi:PAS domain S-box-containing protein
MRFQGLSDRKRLLMLIVLMATVAVTAAGIAMAVLYQAAFEVQRGRLVAVVQNQARLIESIARFNSANTPGGLADIEVILRPVAEAHEKFTGFGETGEFTLARSEGDKMVFLLSHRHHDRNKPQPVPFESTLSEPMRRALKGESGTFVGLDYRGETVLAAYEPVAVLDLGIVAKIDLAEVRAPFIKGGLVSGAGALILIFFGVVLFRRISSPIVANLEGLVDKLEAAQRIARLGNYELDTRNNRVWWSDEVYRIFGLAPERASSTYETFLAAVHPDDRVRVGAAVAQRLEGSEPCALDYRIVWPDGTERIVHSQPELIRDRRGRPVRITGTIQDVTEQKQAEQAIKEGEARLRAIMDTVVDGIVAIDENGMIESANVSAGRIFGYRTEEMVGAHSDTLIPPPDASAERARAGCYVCDGVTSDLGRLREVTGVRRDGADFPLELAVGELSTGGRRLYVVAVRDITERKRIEAALQQAQKMEAVGQLTSGIAHDFKNHLAVIIINLELLEQRLADRTDLQSLAQCALDAADRSAALAQRLLAFSRRRALKPRVTNLNQLISGGMADLLRRTLGETIRVEVKHAARLWPCLADPAQLESALLNLAINARDAMPEGGMLTIETANVRLGDEPGILAEGVAPGDYVMLTVNDTGQGMPAEVAARACEPFFTTKKGGKGSGLGLSMTYGFVRQSGGHMELHSRIGRGTTVKIYLPRAQEGEVASPGGFELPAVQREHAESVLVVEDDAEVRDRVVAMLSELGYRARQAEDGPSALAILDEEPGISVLFTDSVLPGGMSGPALASEARRRRPNLKVLFTTGYETADATSHGQLEETVEVLEKPYRKAELARQLQAVFDGEAA